MQGPKGPEWGEPIGPKNGAVALLLNTVFCCLPVGHLYLGQSKKAVFYFLFQVVSAFFAVGPLVVWVIMQIDAYQLGDRSQRQPVRSLENGVDFLNDVFGPTGVIKP